MSDSFRDVKTRVFQENDATQARLFEQLRCEAKPEVWDLFEESYQ